MNEKSGTAALREIPEYSKEFIWRRHLNWFPLGLMYASYYMCRYNMPIANKHIADHFHWSNQQMGWIITAMFWAYAIGQFINGQITDRIGGRKAILIGAVGTIILNVALGFGKEVGMLTYFIVVWGLNGYLQAFGAPSIVKVNANWFAVAERGTFTGIFGLMIQFGRWAITFLGGFLIMSLPWEYTFYIPALVTLLITILGYFTVKDNPEDVGFPPVEKTSETSNDTEPAGFAYTLKLVLSSKVLWIISGAYFCTGVVRHGLDQWFIKYLAEVHNIATNSPAFMVTAFLIPISAVLGSFAAGIISDYFFKAKRGPVAAIMYFAQFILLLIFAFISGPLISCVLLVILQFFINGPHSLLGGAAAMDFGGRKGAGSAAGLIDCFQYIGAGLTGFGVGIILDQFGWGGWIVSLTGFSFIAGCLMVSIWNAKPKPVS